MTHHGMDAATSTAGRPFAKALGLFSFVRGGIEVAMPERLAAWRGLHGYDPLVRAYGLREIGAGAGTFAPDPRPAIRGRVLGDAVDIGTLVLARSRANPQRRNVNLALAAAVGVTALDLLCAVLLQRAQRRGAKAQASDGALAAVDFSTRSGRPNGRPRPLSTRTQPGDLA